MANHTEGDKGLEEGLLKKEDKIGLPLGPV
jgi:hypothetical protein